MKLSIIVPVYNGEKFIKRCYNSLMNQHLDSVAYEILFIDNNSTDNSVDIIKDISISNYNVKLISQPKQGEAQARNMGVSRAQGEYVYQLDVDDEVFPNALNRMIDVLNSYPNIEAVFGKMLKTDKNLAAYDGSLEETHEVVFKEKPYWGLKWFSNLGTVVGEGAFMHRQTVFQKIGVYSEQLPVIGTDLAFDVKLGMTCNLAFIDTYIYLYFKHEVSLIQGVKRKMPRAFMVWPRLVKEHLPFYFENKTPARFKSLLFSQLFQSMGRQIVFTKGYTNRKQLKQQLEKDLKAIKIPWIIRLYLSILVILPIETLRKVYGYHVVPYSVKQLTK
ncbi:glycosyltransferase family 2 protein [Xanthomarina sp. F1114]|uniref:glycosyltransferase family 2 protein n=1 Tax=Xanthomarina sp. F1114 TaxID=2996019 RepID=UPI00225DF361|nr:glycosyltransferase family 2 protein [Xanthomarina sp. F1114]MCX7549061.1 glycosyltransferase family 2 protein [Xanthomarina sp. F1114]